MSKRSFPLDASGAPIRDLVQPGYYAGYTTLRQKKAWDAATERVVTQRVEQTPPIRFFSPEEAALLESIVDRILPQDDRPAGRTIPIVPVIDNRLFTNELNGYRFEDMLPDREAYRLGMQAIDEMARKRFRAGFPSLPVEQQEILLQSLHDGKPDPPHAAWKRMPVHRFWALLVGDCVAAYYSHPWAWDEIGFGGPAYPRGYMRLENGLPEPWEEDESRYAWRSPLDSVSDLPAQPFGNGASPARGDKH